MTRLTLRMPEKVYTGLEEIKKRKPHLSMNALIIEALTSAIADEEEKERIRAGNTQINTGVLKG